MNDTTNTVSAPATTPSATDGATTPSTPSTPATPAAPATVTPSATPDSSSGDVVDSSAFEFMFNSTEADPFEGPGSSPQTTEPPTVAPTQPAPAQPVTSVVTAPQPTVPSTTATPAPTETPSPVTPTPASPNLDPFDPGTLARHLSENEEQVIQHLADSTFKLSDKDVEDLESNTVGTIPRLLARAFVLSQRNFLMQMSQIVPRMVQTHGEVTKRHTEAEGEFYTRWPDVKKDQHGPLVMKYAAVYRQMHPEASRKDMIEALGPMVMMAANVVPSAQVPVAPGASPMATNGIRPPQPAPFVPAGPSAGGAIPSIAPQLSPVEAMFVGDTE